MKLLLIEDDEMIGDSLVSGLKHDGFVIDWMQNASDGEYAVSTNHYDLILLDLGLPDYSGIELLQNIRNNQNKTPTIILTARDAVQDRVLGLDSGADDYLVKPFSYDELRARIRAVTRRQDGRVVSCISHYGLELNATTSEFTLNGKTEKLSTKEFALLEILMQNIGTPFTKEMLEERLYSWEESAVSNTIEVFIYSLRKKLGSQWIKNIRGLGYFMSKVIDE